jgi:hypothetical protein
MRHWPVGSDARRVLVAAGHWLAARRRGTSGYQASGGGGAAAADRMAPVSPPPGWRCHGDQRRRSGNPAAPSQPRPPGHGNRLTSSSPRAWGGPDGRRRIADSRARASIGWVMAVKLFVTGSRRLRAAMRVGEMALAHPMGLLVQFAGLVPSSRRCLNRLATPMVGWGPNSVMDSCKPSAWAAHSSCSGRPPAVMRFTTTR